MSSENLKKTPLNDEHRKLGGKMVDFGGWDMPVQYPAGVIEEHLRTRTACGLFDVSHMGEIFVEGEDAIAFVNRITTNDVTKLVDGQAHYSALTNENGGVVDDLLVYRFFHDKLLLVVNAGTTEKDWDWISSHLKDEAVTLTNASADYCQIAIQGPKALELAQKLTDTNLENIKYYHFTVGIFDGVDAIISRTGYTGEDGFEIYADADKAVQLWNKILETGNYGDGRRNFAVRSGGAKYSAFGIGNVALRTRTRRRHFAARSRSRLDLQTKKRFRFYRARCSSQTKRKRLGAKARRI